MYAYTCGDIYILNVNKVVNIGEYVSEEEVLAAINELNENKSPGNDGISAEFYKTFKLILTPLLCMVYNTLLLRGELPESFRAGIVTLMYKNKGDLDNLKNWRPISLLNVDYKIFTKIFKNRLKKNATQIINNLQSCGPGDRSIINNALNLKTIQEYVINENQKALFIAIDQEKAFDRIEHNYLITVLRKFQFPDLFLKFVTLINTNIFSNVLINGKFSNKIQIQRSVRQGCPLSMYLYSLALEPLVDKIKNNIHIEGIKIPNYEPIVKTVQHADDTTAIVTTETSYIYLKKDLNFF